MSSRWFLYVPEFDKDSFVFFFAKGPTGKSWSVRQFSEAGHSVRRASEFPWTASQILEMADRPGSHKRVAEAHEVKDTAWYLDRISQLNREVLGIDSPSQTSPPPAVAVVSDHVEPLYPIIDLDRLMAHPKAGKRKDMDRILKSGHSEDYVSWNVMRGLARRGGQVWWPEMVELVGRTGVQGGLPANDPPAVELWRSVTSPRDYESASRSRMAASDNPVWQERAMKFDRVEGATEVDIELQGESYLIYVEAKLHSDISWATTYDPQRNQIARNIDCLLENAAGRTPHFWMFVKDRGPGHGYTQTIESYRTNPSSLASLIPHRSPELVAEVASRIAVLTWSELLTLLPTDDDLAHAFTELRRRVN